VTKLYFKAAGDQAGTTYLLLAQALWARATAIFDYSAAGGAILYDAYLVHGSYEQTMFTYQGYTTWNYGEF